MNLEQIFGQKMGRDPEKDPRFSVRPIRIHSVTLLSDTEKPSAAPKVRIAFEITNPPGPYSMQFLTVAGGEELKIAFPVDATATYVESRDGATLRAIRSLQGVLYQELR